jgi:lysophospholipase
MDVAPSPKLFETPDNPAPLNATCQTIVTSDGVKLRAMSAPSALKDVRGTVLLLNGRADYIERYFETTRELQARGFHVVAFDWRGQGASDRLTGDRLRGFVRRFSQFDEDLRTIMDKLVLPSCPAPYYALGHSTGGHILLRNVFGKSWFRRAVCTSPLLEFQYGTWPKPAAYLLAAMACAFGLGRLYLPGYAHGPLLLRGFANNPLTSDKHRWDRDERTLTEHPKLGVGGPTFAWFFAALLSFERLNREKRRSGPTCPVLLVTAGRDSVVDVRATQEFASHVPGITQVMIADSLHEILIERDAIRIEFWAAFDSYIASA